MDEIAGTKPIAEPAFGLPWRQLSAFRSPKKHDRVTRDNGISHPQSYARSEDMLDVFNVQTLDRYCKSPAQEPLHWECFGYVRAVTDMLIAQKIICVGDRFSYGAMTQAFVNWADAHPEKWNEFQVIGVTQALRVRPISS
jgi:hypothetical protein